MHKCFLNWVPLPLSVRQLVTAIARVSGHYHKLLCAMCFHELKVNLNPQGLHYDSCYLTRMQILRGKAWEILQHVAMSS